MTSLIWLGIFALVAIPVGIIMGLYDIFQDARKHRKLPPEEKQRSLEYHQEIAKEATKAVFSPTVKFGLLFLVAIVIFVAIGNR